MTLDRLVEIRPLVADDLPALRHLHAQAFQASAASILTQHQLKKARDWISGLDVFEDVLAATRAGQVYGGHIDQTLVAVAGWTEGGGPAAAAQLRWVATDPLFAGNGIARRIVMHAEFAASAHFQSRFAVRALPTVAPFYEKLGYHETGRGTQPALQGAPLPVVHLSKTLRHSNTEHGTRH